jgi:hypothetical protein
MFSFPAYSPLCSRIGDVEVFERIVQRGEEESSSCYTRRFKKTIGDLLRIGAMKECDHYVVHSEDDLKDLSISSFFCRSKDCENSRDIEFYWRSIEQQKPVITGYRQWNNPGPTTKDNCGRVFEVCEFVRTRVEVPASGKTSVATSIKSVKRRHTTLHHESAREKKKTKPNHEQKCSFPINTSPFERCLYYNTFGLVESRMGIIEGLETIISSFIDTKVPWLKTVVAYSDWIHVATLLCHLITAIISFRNTQGKARGWLFAINLITISTSLTLFLAKHISTIGSHVYALWLWLCGDDREIATIMKDFMGPHAIPYDHLFHQCGQAWRVIKMPCYEGCEHTETGRFGISNPKFEKITTNNVQYQLLDCGCHATIPIFQVEARSWMDIMPTIVSSVSTWFMSAMLMTGCIDNKWMHEKANNMRDAKVLTGDVKEMTKSIIDQIKDNMVSPNEIHLMQLQNLALDCAKIEQTPMTAMLADVNLCHTAKNISNRAIDIMSKIKKDPKISPAITSLCMQVNMQLNTINSRVQLVEAVMDSKDRVDPVGVVLSGPPALGKTSLLSALHERVAANMRWPNSGIYDYRPDAKHNTVFGGETAFRFEDFCQLRSLAKDPMIEVMNQVFSSNPWNIAGAHLETKNSYLTSKIGYLTTNHQPLTEADLDHFVRDTRHAVMTRLLWFRISDPVVENSENPREEVFNHRREDFSHLTIEKMQLPYGAGDQGEILTFEELVTKITKQAQVKELSFLQKLRRLAKYQTLPPDVRHEHEVRINELTAAVQELVVAREDQIFKILRFQGPPGVGKTRMARLVGFRLSQLLKLPIKDVFTFDEQTALVSPKIYVIDDKIMTEADEFEYMKWISSLHKDSILILCTNQVFTLKKSMTGRLMGAGAALGLCKDVPPQSKHYWNVNFSGAKQGLARRIGLPGYVGYDSVPVPNNSSVCFTFESTISVVKNGLDKLASTPEAILDSLQDFVEYYKRNDTTLIKSDHDLSGIKTDIRITTPNIRELVNCLQGAMSIMTAFQSVNGWHGVRFEVSPEAMTKFYVVPEDFTMPHPNMHVRDVCQGLMAVVLRNDPTLNVKVSILDTNQNIYFRGREYSGISFEDQPIKITNTDDVVHIEWELEGEEYEQFLDVASAANQMVTPSEIQWLQTMTLKCLYKDAVEAYVVDNPQSRLAAFIRIREARISVPWYAKTWVWIQDHWLLLSVLIACCILFSLLIGFICKQNTMTIKIEPGQRLEDELTDIDLVCDTMNACTSRRRWMSPEMYELWKQKMREIDSNERSYDDEAFVRDMASTEMGRKAIRNKKAEMSHWDNPMVNNYLSKYEDDGYYSVDAYNIEIVEKPQTKEHPDCPLKSASRHKHYCDQCKTLFQHTHAPKKEHAMLCKKCQEVQARAIGNVLPFKATDTALTNFLETINKNAVLVISTGGVHGIGLHGHTVMTVGHIAAGVGAPVEVSMDTPDGKGASIYTGSVIALSRRHDLCLVEIDKRAPPFRDIRKHILRDPVTEEVEAVACKYSRRGLPMMSTTKSIRFVENAPLTDESNPFFRPSASVYACSPEYQTSPMNMGVGDCGLPLILRDSNASFKIGGLYIAGNSIADFYTSVTLKEVQLLTPVTAMAATEGYNLQNVAMLYPEEEMRILRNKKEAKFESKHNIIHGFCPEFLDYTREKKEFHCLLPLDRTKMNLPLLTKPAPQSITKGMNVSELKCDVNGVPNILFTQVDKYAENLPEDPNPNKLEKMLLNKLAKRFWCRYSKLKPMSDAQILNGERNPNSPNFGVVKAMDMTKSSGNIGKAIDAKKIKSKGDFFRNTAEPGQVQNWTADTEYGKRIFAIANEADEHCMRGQPYGGIYKCSKKVEILPKEKADACGTRAFAAMDMHHLIQQKRWFGTYSAEMQKDRAQVSSQKGMDPITEFTPLVKQLQQVDGELIAIDYKRFDKSVPYWCRELFYNIVSECMEPIPGVDMKQFYSTMAKSHAYSFISFDGVIMQTKKGTGVFSGEWLTTLLDCFSNWSCLILSIIRSLIRKILSNCEHMTREEQVRKVLKEFPTDQILLKKIIIKTYGDDAVIKICKSLEISFEDLVDGAKLMGMTITRADKISGTDNVQFISRSLELDQSTNLCFAGLKLESFTKVLHWVRSYNVDDITHNLESALLCAASHDKRMYKLVSDDVQTIINNLPKMMSIEVRNKMSIPPYSHLRRSLASVIRGGALKMTPLFGVGNQNFEQDFCDIDGLNIKEQNLIEEVFKEENFKEEEKPKFSEVVSVQSRMNPQASTSVQSEYMCKGAVPSSPSEYVVMCKEWYDKHPNVPRVTERSFPAGTKYWQYTAVTLEGGDLEYPIIYVAEKKTDAKNIAYRSLWLWLCKAHPDVTTKDVSQTWETCLTHKSLVSGGIYEIVFEPIESARGGTSKRCCEIGIQTIKINGGRPQNFRPLYVRNGKEYVQAAIRVQARSCCDRNIGMDWQECLRHGNLTPGKTYSIVFIKDKHYNCCTLEEEVDTLVINRRDYGDVKLPKDVWGMYSYTVPIEVQARSDPAIDVGSMVGVAENSRNAQSGLQPKMLQGATISEPTIPASPQVMMGTGIMPHQPVMEINSGLPNVSGVLGPRLNLMDHLSIPRFVRKTDVDGAVAPGTMLDTFLWGKDFPPALQLFNGLHLFSAGTVRYKFTIEMLPTGKGSIAIFLAEEQVLAKPSVTFAEIQQFRHVIIKCNTPDFEEISIDLPRTATSYVAPLSRPGGNGELGIGIAVWTEFKPTFPEASTLAAISVYAHPLLGPAHSNPYWVQDFREEAIPFPMKSITAQTTTIGATIESMLHSRPDEEVFLTIDGRKQVLQDGYVWQHLFETTLLPFSDRPTPDRAALIPMTGSIMKIDVSTHNTFAGMPIPLEAKAIAIFHEVFGPHEETRKFITEREYHTVEQEQAEHNLWLGRWGGYDFVAGENIGCEDQPLLRQGIFNATINVFQNFKESNSGVFPAPLFIEDISNVTYIDTMSTNFLIRHYLAFLTSDEWDDTDNKIAYTSLAPKDVNFENKIAVVGTSVPTGMCSLVVRRQPPKNVSDTPLITNGTVPQDTDWVREMYRICKELNVDINGNFILSGLIQDQLNGRIIAPFAFNPRTGITYANAPVTKPYYVYNTTVNQAIITNVRVGGASGIGSVDMANGWTPRVIDATLSSGTSQLSLHELRRAIALPVESRAALGMMMAGGVMQGIGSAIGQHSQNKQQLKMQENQFKHESAMQDDQQAHLRGMADKMHGFNVQRDIMSQTHQLEMQHNAFLQQHRMADKAFANQMSMMGARVSV